MSDDWKQYLREEMGEHLRTLREEAGLSQEQLFRRTGVLQSSISAVEQGHRFFSIPTLAKLAQGLGVSLQELMPPLTLDAYPEALD